MSSDLSPKMSPRGQVSHTFVILFGLLLISMTAWIFSGLEERMQAETRCRLLLGDLNSELILAEAYSGRYSYYERKISVPDSEVLFRENKMLCGDYSRETNINLGGLGSFREGLQVISYKNGKRV